MRRTVWVVVLTLLVLAVVAQSIAVVEHRSFDEFTEFREQPDGRVIKIRNLPPRFGTPVISASRADASQTRSSTSRRNKTAPPDDKEVIWRATVESKMLPTNAAYEDVMDRAVSRIMHDLDLSRPPSREYVRNRMLEKYEPKKGPTVEGVTETISVVYELSATREVMRELARFERESRVRERMGGLAMITAIITVALACIAGYIRLDEYTKGYYTWRLRLVGVAIIGIVTIVLANEM
jgi:hypothetical protein